MPAKNRFSPLIAAIKIDVAVSPALCIFVNMVVGPFHQGQWLGLLQGQWLGLLLGLAFSLALLLEIASGANQSPTLLAAVVAGVAILVVSAVILGWEAAAFMLVFLAIWLLS